MESYTHEMVIFAYFIERGLALPTSDFFRGLLRYYNLELVHLNPNSILHIAIFVHLYEAFLEIQPHFQLFRKSFRVKPQARMDHTEIVGEWGA